MNRFRSVGTATALALAILGPAVAHACAVCGAGGADRSQSAFFDTTIFLSLLPLGMIGGGVLWLRRAGGMISGEFEERHAFDPKVLEPGSQTGDGTSSAAAERGEGSEPRS